MKRILQIVIALIFVSVMSVAFSIVMAFPKPRIFILGGSHIAEAVLFDGTRVRVDMAPIFPGILAEYERRITVCPVEKFTCHSKWLLVDSGGFRKINLYRRPVGSLVAVDHAWMMQLTGVPKIRIFRHAEEESMKLRKRRWRCRNEDPAPLHASGVVTSRYFRTLDYLGTFEFFLEDNRLAQTVRFGTFKFLTATEHGEQLCEYPVRG